MIPDHSSQFQYMLQSFYPVNSFIFKFCHTSCVVSFGHVEKVSSEILYACLNRSEIKGNQLTRLSRQIIDWVYP